jgi:hypothetical protein
VKPLAAPPTQTGYVKFEGGVDKSTPALSIQPGNAADSMNYEPGVYSGYQSIDGFERFSGQPSPSAAVYYHAPATLSGTPAVGNTITGSTSGATGVICRVDGTTLSLTKVAGTFVAESFTGGGGGSFALAPVLGGYPTGYDDAVSINAAADIYRTDIATVNGARPIRGLQMYKGVLYAFVNNAGNTACELFKSTASGWAAVALGRELAFTSGGTYVPAEGDVITGEISGATATLTRIALESGSYAAGTAAGKFIFASQTGTFQAETVKVGANLNIANIAGNASAITLLPSGQYEFVNYNFTGSADTLRMYGCDGVNRAFEFDGTVFVPIKTGMTTDTPSHISAYRSMLFLSFRGSSQNSGIGTPYVWTPLTGASEIGIGDTITGYSPQPGGALAIISRNSIDQLAGTSVVDFVKTPLSTDSGAIAYTVQSLENKIYALDDRGIIEVTRVQSFGNFDTGSVSQKVQALVDAIRSKVIASSVYRSRNQYRLYANDGTGLIMTVVGGNVVGIMPFDYNYGRTTNLINVTCVCSGEDATGKDVVFFGADNGYVYQADKGSSFDGYDIRRFLRMPFNNIKSPRIIKEYMKAILEMTSVGYSEIRFQPEFSYGDSNIQPHEITTETVQGAGGYWDVDSWDSFFYDGKTINNPEFHITGQGINLAMIFYSSNDIDPGHTLHGLLIHYILRQISR